MVSLFSPFFSLFSSFALSSLGAVEFERTKLSSSVVRKQGWTVSFARKVLVADHTQTDRSRNSSVHKM